MITAKTALPTCLPIELLHYTEIQHALRKALFARHNAGKPPLIVSDIMWVLSAALGTPLLHSSTQDSVDMNATVYVQNEAEFVDFCSRPLTYLELMRSKLASSQKDDSDRSNLSVLEILQVLRSLLVAAHESNIEVAALEIPQAWADILLARPGGHKTLEGVLPYTTVTASADDLVHLVRKPSRYVVFKVGTLVKHKPTGCVYRITSDFDCSDFCKAILVSPLTGQGMTEISHDLGIDDLELYALPF